MRKTVPFLFVCLAACSGGGTPDAGAPTLHTPAGDILATATDLPAGARALGIPYATATGTAPSVAAAPFATPFDGSSFGTACPGTTTSRATGDDCLRLNVWTPDPSPATPAPVLVLVPAGGDDVGAAALSGLTFSHVGGVLVSVQHRAPPLGVHATSAADVAATGAAFGDLSLALAWVRRNAAALGGDPTQVLVFGDGEGAGLVCGMLAAGLLGDARVGLMSGTCLDVPAGRFSALPRATTDVFSDPAVTLPPMLTGWNADEDASVACAARRLAAAWDTRGAPVFVYENTFGTARGPRSELPYVMGNPPAGRAFTDAEAALVYTIMSTWVDFAHDGDATTGPGGSWPRWTRASPMAATFALDLPAVADMTCP